MADKVKIDHPGTYKLTDGLKAAATTDAEKGFARRIEAAKLYDMELEAGKDKLENFGGVTDDQFTAWIAANKGKKVVIPEMKFSFAEKGKVFKEDFVQQMERKDAQGDDAAAKYAIAMLIKGVTEMTTPSGNKVSFTQGSQTSAQAPGA